MDTVKFSTNMNWVSALLIIRAIEGLDIMVLIDKTGEYSTMSIRFKKMADMEKLVCVLYDLKVEYETC